MLKMQIRSDGTMEGTTLLVNGEEVTGLTQCSFSCYGDGKPYFSYTTETVEDQESGLVKVTTYYLADDYKMQQMAKDGQYEGKAILGSKQYTLVSISRVVVK